MSKKMVRRCYRMYEKQDKKVKQAAKKQKVSEAEIIRDLIDKNLCIK